VSLVVQAFPGLHRGTDPLPKLRAGDGIRETSAILSNTGNMPEKERFFWRIRCAALKKGIFFRRSYGIAKAMP